jgi:hypothetical protein
MIPRQRFLDPRGKPWLQESPIALSSRPMETMKSKRLHSRLGPVLLALAFLLIFPGPAPAAELRQLAAKVMQLDVTDPASVDRLAPADDGTFRTWSGEQMAW